MREGIRLKYTGKELVEHAGIKFKHHSAEAEKIKKSIPKEAFDEELEGDDPTAQMLSSLDKLNQKVRAIPAVQEFEKHRTLASWFAAVAERLDQNETYLLDGRDIGMLELVSDAK